MNKQNFQSCFIKKTDGSLHYIVARQRSQQAPLLIFVHGFPESSYAWKHYLSIFFELGFNVLALDLRSSPLSSGFTNICHFNMALLVKDLQEVILKYKTEKVILIGHDLGGAVIWALSEQYPELVQAIITLNCPHHSAFHKMFRRNPLLTLRQTFRFWYMYFFQLPKIPEWLMSKGNFFWLNYIFKRWIKKNKKSIPNLLSIYKKQLSSKAMLKKAIAPYRANVFGKYGRSVLSPFIIKKPTKKTLCPSLVFSGNNDFVLESRLFDEMKLSFDEKISLCQINNAGHWLHHEYQSEVIQVILDWLKENNLIGQARIETDSIAKNNMSYLNDELESIFKKLAINRGAL